jgi:hypothetical protein
VSLRYYRLGDETKQPAEAYLRDYYAFYGPMADQVVQGMLTTLKAIKVAAQAYGAVGCVRVNLDADGGQSQPG